MMVSPWIHHVLVYGALAMIVGSLWVFWSRDAPVTVPSAVAIGGPLHALRRKLVRVAPWLGLVGGAVGGIYVYTQSTDIVLVTDDGDHPSARRLVEIGSSPSDGNETMLDELGSRVWLINHSTHTVRVETVQYGQALLPDEPDLVPPGAIRKLVSIDHIGPDDPPPSTVTDDYNLHMDQRTWLTWE